MQRPFLEAALISLQLREGKVNNSFLLQVGGDLLGAPCGFFDDLNFTNLAITLPIDNLLQHIQIIKALCTKHPSRTMAHTSFLCDLDVFETKLFR